ncbi:MAG: ATP-dependent Clp protease adaptor ClpS [Planctomycetes bacterium]|nr:ATP-dependent Clp protease adaptor ClpS [Planctomycetota bacterium]
MPDDTPTGRAPKEERPTGSSTWGEDPTRLTPMVKIVFVDDNETPVDFVLHLLETYLDYEEERARQAVNVLQSHGRLIVAELLPPLAENAARRMESAARAAGYPFRLEVQEQAS